VLQAIAALGLIRAPSYSSTGFDSKL